MGATATTTRWLLMVGIDAGLYVWFKRIRWL